MSASPAIKLNCRWSLEASSFSWFCQPAFVFYAPVDRNVCKKAALCGRNVEFCRLLSRFPPLENVSAGSLWSHGCCYIYRVVRGGDSDPTCRQRRYEFESVAWNYKIAGRCSGEDESLFCHIYVAKDATEQHYRRICCRSVKNWPEVILKRLRCFFYVLHHPQSQILR